MSDPAPSPAMPEGHMDDHVGSHSVNKWLVLVIVCLAQFMVVLDATIVNVALPSIQADLDLSPENLQWIVNAYTLVFGGFLLLGGRAADLLGRKRLFVAGLAVFSAASLVNALATTGEMLIVARGFQGLGAALVSPAALSIITTTFDEGPERTKALSRLGRHRRRRRRVRPAARRDPHRGAQLGVDLLHQRADRHRHDRRRAALRARVAARGARCATSTSPAP